MIKLYLIRHSKTYGNTQKRYIGVTDESLCEEGKLLLEKNIEKNLYQPVERIYTSPLKRCVETAKIIYPQQEPKIVPLLAECDFGEFENKNYLELSDNPNYQKWVDSNATLPFPKGESREEFQERCIRGFEQVVQECIEQSCEKAALTIHGGTIMSIMTAFAKPKKEFHEWWLDNGQCYEIDIEEKNWKEDKRGFLSWCLHS